MRRTVSTVVAALGVALILGTQGCDVGSSDSGTGTGASGADECQDLRLDLTRPPTRAELDMPAGESTSDVSCDGGFQVDLVLPGNATTTLTAIRVNADSYGSEESTTGDPTTIDIHSVALDQDQAIQVADGVAGDLGIDSKPLQTWQLDISADPSQSVDSPFLRSKLGYLTAELQLQYLPTSGNSYLHLILTWA